MQRNAPEMEMSQVMKMKLLLHASVNKSAFRQNYIDKKAFY